MHRLVLHDTRIVASPSITRNRMVCQEVRTLLHTSAVDSLVRVSRRGGGCPGLSS